MAESIVSYKQTQNVTTNTNLMCIITLVFLNLKKKNQKFEITNRWNNAVVAHKRRRDAEAYHKEGKSNHHFNSKKKKICNTFPY